MDAVDRRTFELPLAAFALVLLPMLMINASGLLIGWYGYPFDHLANAVVRNGHAEAAGRLRMLAAWLLLAVVALGHVVYFAWSLRSFARTTAWRLALAYVVLAACGAASIASGKVEGAERYVDPRVICDAFALAEAPAAPASAAKVASPPELAEYGPPRGATGGPAPACPGSENFALMLRLNEIQKYLLALLIPAVALGTIGCLALPARASEADCRDQARRLNVQLNLTAAWLVIGLLFLGALLRWPGFAFAGAAAAAYKAHVDAYLVFWGVSYSLLIASYYVPVAIWLERACARTGAKAPAAKAGGEAGKGPAADLFGLLKTGAALFAPTIAGVLGGVLDL